MTRAGETGHIPSAAGAPASVTPSRQPMRMPARPSAVRLTTVLRCVMLALASTANLGCPGLTGTDDDDPDDQRLFFVNNSGGDFPCTLKVVYTGGVSPNSNGPAWPRIAPPGWQTDVAVHGEGTVIVTIETPPPNRSVPDSYAAIGRRVAGCHFIYWSAAGGEHKYEAVNTLVDPVYGAADVLYPYPEEFVRLYGRLPPYPTPQSAVIRVFRSDRCPYGC